MIIPIPTGMKYTGRAWGSTVKRVICAHCGAAYVYEMRRMVESESNAAGFIGMDKAKARALSGAKESLTYALANEHDLVPCPSCGRLQAGMNWILRRRWMLGIVCGCGALWFGAFLRYEKALMDSRPSPGWTTWIPIAGTVIALAGLVGVMCKEFGAAATDRAQLNSVAEAEGFARVGMPRMVGDGWIWLRASQFVSPRVCSGCGGRSSRMLVRGLGVLRMQIQVCGACYEEAVRKRMVWGGMTLLAPSAAVFLVCWGAMGWNLRAAATWGVLVGGLAGLLSWAVVNNWLLGGVGMPVRFRKYRDRQDSVEVKFKSAAAAEEFVAGVIREMRARMGRVAVQTTGVRASD